MNVVIREMNEHDYPAVLLLWNNELGNSYVNAGNIARHYEKMCKDENYKTFIASVDGETVGFITTVQVMAMGLEVGYLKINGLAVLESWQGKGIGTKLVKHIENDALNKGLSRIILNSGFERVEAHAFYEHNQFEKGSYCFSKKV